MKHVIVTRHAALIDYLKDLGITGDVVPHATPEQIAGKHVIGVLPLSLAQCCATVTEVPLSIPSELRGKELSVEQVRQFAGELTTYVVGKVSQPW